MEIYKTAKGIGILELLGVGAISTFVGYIDYIKLSPYFQGVWGAGMILGVPSPALGIITALVGVAILTLRYTHRLRMQIEEGYKEIAELRGRGVKIRNMGTGRFANDEALRAWGKDVLDWNEETKEALKKVSVAISIWFATLDTVPILPRVGIDTTVSPEHMKLFREHDRRLHNLGQLIRDLWGIGEAHKEDVSR
jgi:hypothetical protein